MSSIGRRLTNLEAAILRVLERSQLSGLAIYYALRGGPDEIPLGMTPVTLRDMERELLISRVDPTHPKDKGENDQTLFSATTIGLAAILELDPTTSVNGGESTTPPVAEYRF